MDQNAIHHALEVDGTRCRGCSHCMSVCPTDAIRVREGKTIIYQNRCIDCGKCFRICPESAIIVKQDDFNNIFNYKRRVALVPSILKGQFPDDIPKRKIYSVLLDMGFTDIFEVGFMWPVFQLATARYMKDNKHKKPFISSFCPAVVRLIQTRFPSLLDHVVPMKAPVDIAALFYRKKLRDEGVRDEDIGTFYVTPCAAKISAVKSPHPEDETLLNGLINMDYIYNRALRRIRRKEKESNPLPSQRTLCEKGILWCLTNGESDYARGRTLAIDGVANVIEFLENLENEEIPDIDFLELRSCDESCAGGVLTTRNRFLTVERLRNRAVSARKMAALVEDPQWDEVYEATEYLIDNIMLGEIQAQPAQKLDEDMGKAMVKMEKIRKIMEFLPKVDCGICGSPNCQSLAEDIVRGTARIQQCVFVQRKMVKSGQMTPKDVSKTMDKIWGKKLNKEKSKDGESNEGI